MFHTLAPQDFLLLGGVAVLLCCSALVSASETAFFSLSPHQAEGLRNRPSRSNSAALRLLDKSDYLLSTILIANNLVNICIVILSNALINSWIDFGGATGLEFAVKMVVVTFLLLLFGEIMPKIFATYNSLRVIGLMAVPLRFLCALFRPVSYLLIRSGSLINRRMAQKKVNISMDELSNAIEMTSDQTVEEKKILSGIVEFVNTEVGEIMRSRVEVVALDETEDFARVKEVIMQSGYSRIPVYEENLDNVRGILYVKDVLPYISAADDFGWTNLCRKPYFVPEHKKINDLLADFQSNKIHMAIVVDEYGSTLGLVSLEDIIEEIVGEISDESDADESFFTRLDEKCFIFDGKSHLGDFERVLGLDEEIFNDVKGEAETLAGLMLELKRDFPRKGDVFTSHDIRFTVQEMDGHRIDKIRVDLLA